MHHQHLIHPRVGACDRVVSVDGGSDNDPSTRQMTPASAFQHRHNKPAQFPGYIQHHLPGSPSSQGSQDNVQLYRRRIPPPHSTHGRDQRPSVAGCHYLCRAGGTWPRLAVMPASAGYRQCPHPHSRIPILPWPLLQFVQSPIQAFLKMLHAFSQWFILKLSSKVIQPCPQKLQPLCKSFVSYFFEVLFSSGNVSLQ